jgi:hypothetical protein
MRKIRVVTKPYKTRLTCPNAHLTRDKAWLEARYFADNLSLAKIAKLIPCSTRAIHRCFVRLEIPFKPKHITYGDIKQPPRHSHHNGMWKGGNNKCIDCAKLLSTRNAKRCKKCYGLSCRKPAQTKPDDLIRHSADYRDWRNMVFIRDGYKCQICGFNNNNLKAHHLDGFSIAPNKRFDVNNGVTLCNDHHIQFHKEYGFGGNTKEQFDEFSAIMEM